MKPSTLQSDFSAKLSVKKNAAKARTTSFLFFILGGWGMGKVGAFQGSFNPLSGLSIFETCVIPVFCVALWL